MAIEKAGVIDRGVTFIRFSAALDPLHIGSLQNLGALVEKKNW